MIRPRLRGGNFKHFCCHKRCENEPSRDFEKEETWDSARELNKITGAEGITALMRDTQIINIIIRTTRTADATHCYTRRADDSFASWKKVLSVPGDGT